MNMKKKTRFLSALLAVLMAVGPLASCANTGDTNDDVDQTTAAVGEEETKLDSLPNDLNYGNEEITIISRDMEGWTRGEISVEKLNGDAVNDAIYERNKAVEQRLNVKINSMLENTADSSLVISKVATAVKAGTGEYDIMAGTSYHAASESLNGTFVNLLDTEHLNLEQPYWTQGYNEAMSYNGMQFSALGHMMLSIYRFAFVTVFNKNLFTDANQPFLYDTVEAGQWTLDKQASLVPLFHRDNGNGQQDQDGDTYGFISSRLISTDAYWSSCQVDIIKKNGDGELELVFDSAKLYEVAEKVLALYYGTNNASYTMAAYGSDSEQDDIRNMFSQGFGAMATLRIMALESSIMRNMEHEYGVLPMPKFDEVQEGYHTLLHDQFTIVSIPTTVTGERLDMVSAVVEAMGSASYQIVKPVYYEETLRTKIAQDPQSALMMDIITDGLYIDAGIIYLNTIGSFHDGLRTIVGNNNNNAVSMFKAKMKSAQKSLEKDLMKKLDKIAAESAS